MNFPDAARKFEGLAHANVKTRNDVVTKNRPVGTFDLAIQEQYLPNELEIKIRLKRVSPGLCILSDDPCVVKLMKRLEIRIFN